MLVFTLSRIELSQYYTPGRGEIVPCNVIN